MTVSISAFKEVGERRKGEVEISRARPFGYSFCRATECLARPMVTIIQPTPYVSLESRRHLNLDMFHGDR